jgi:hypothetical protein
MTTLYTSAQNGQAHLMVTEESIEQLPVPWQRCTHPALPMQMPMRRSLLMAMKFDMWSQNLRIVACHMPTLNIRCVSRHTSEWTRPLSAWSHLSRDNSVYVHPVFPSTCKWAGPSHGHEILLPNALCVHQIGRLLEISEHTSSVLNVFSQFFLKIGW